MCRRAPDGRSPFLSSCWVSFLLSSGGSERLRSFTVLHAMWHVSSASVLRRQLLSAVCPRAKDVRVRPAPSVDTLTSPNQTCEKLNPTQVRRRISSNRPLTGPSARWMRPRTCRAFIDGVVGQREVRPNVAFIIRATRPQAQTLPSAHYQRPGVENKSLPVFAGARWKSPQISSGWKFSFIFRWKENKLKLRSNSPAEQTHINSGTVSVCLECCGKLLHFHFFCCLH